MSARDVLAARQQDLRNAREFGTAQQVADAAAAVKRAARAVVRKSYPNSKL
jgi:hypothetical protein